MVGPGFCDIYDFIFYLTDIILQDFDYMYIYIIQKVQTWKKVKEDEFRDYFASLETLEINFQRNISYIVWEDEFHTYLFSTSSTIQMVCINGVENEFELSAQREQLFLNNYFFLV